MSVRVLAFSSYFIFSQEILIFFFFSLFLLTKYWDQFFWEVHNLVYHLFLEISHFEIFFFWRNYFISSLYCTLNVTALIFFCWFIFVLVGLKKTWFTTYFTEYIRNWKLKFSWRFFINNLCLFYSIWEYSMKTAFSKQYSLLFFDKVKIRFLGELGENGYIN